MIQITITKELFKWRCEPGGPIGRIDTPKCENPLVYTKQESCGRIKDKNGPWGACLEKIEKNILKILFESCIFDLCGLEKEKEKQDIALCRIYEELSDSCLEISKILKLNWKIEWRELTKCSKLKHYLKL